MITTGELFQNLIFYATHQTPEKIVEKLFFHYVLHREKNKLCPTFSAAGAAEWNARCQARKRIE